ncbi:hypothetical protein CQA09_29330, partial [Klebsiella pneumoniae]
ASCCDVQDDFKSRGNLEQEKAAKKLEERSLYRLETKATSCGFIYRVINDASCCDVQDDFKSRGNLEQEKAAKKLEERSLYR